MGNEMETAENVEIVEEIEQEPVSVEGEDNSAQNEEAEQDEIQISIGEEPPPHEQERAPEWVRDLRKANREKERRIRELESRLQSTETKPVELGKRPTLEENDYDTDRYENSLNAWYERKRQVDEVSAREQYAEMVNRQAWEKKLDGYSKAKADLKVRDYDDAEALAQEIFTADQQGYIVHCAKNSAQVVYALGKNPGKAKELAAIKDPLYFAYALSDLEKEIKVTNRKAAPPPEKIVSGTGRSSGAVDSTLERLRADAEKTGNYTKVVAYRQQKRET